MDRKEYRDSLKYDGRIPEPPYECPSCAALRAELEQFRYGIGCMTTIKGDMVMRPDDPLGMAQEIARYVDSLRAELERTERMWSEDRAAVKDWAAASDAIGELYEILGITKDSAGFEDGFTKIVAAVHAALVRADNARLREAVETLCRETLGAVIDATTIVQVEKLSGNIVKEEYAKGQLHSLRLLESWLDRHFAEIMTELRRRAKEGK